MIDAGRRSNHGAHRPVPSTSYTDSRGRRKVVRYWLMEIADGNFTPTDEVDEIRWAEPNAAASLLSYERDRRLLASLPPG